MASQAEAPAKATVTASGTKGLTLLSFSARNIGPEPIACGIAVAHWYSVDLGVAARGQTVREALWASPATGAIFVLNDKGDHLAVESLWCGFAGRSWTTRSLVTLERHVGAVPKGIHLICRGHGERLQCL